MQALQGNKRLVNNCDERPGYLNQVTMYLLYVIDLIGGLYFVFFHLFSLVKRDQNI